MPGFAWSADQDGTLEFVNPRFLEYTGKRIEDFNRVDGMPSFGRIEVLHADDVDHTIKAVQHAVETGDPYGVEHRVRRFDGTYRWFPAFPRCVCTIGGTGRTPTSMTGSGPRRPCERANGVEPVSRDAAGHSVAHYPRWRGGLH